MRRRKALAGSCVFAVAVMLATSGQVSALTLSIPYLSSPPALDGVIAPGEYNSPFYVDFTGHPNPGQFWSGSATSTLPATQLSSLIYGGYTSSTLYLAFKVTDPPVAGQSIDPSHPWFNNAVELFIGGVPGSPDFTPPNRTGSRAAFQIIADSFGNKFTLAGTAGNSFTNADWSVATTRSATGYVIEFAIPLSLIQTPTGIAGPNSNLAFNVGWDANYNLTPGQEYQGILWHIVLPGADSPFATGIAGWAVDLQLAPPDLAIPAYSSWVLMVTAVLVGSIGCGFLRRRGVSDGFPTREKAKHFA